MYETALSILKIFYDHHFKAYIVGGYPRDLYLNRKSIDIDICTNATPKEITELFKESMVSKQQYGSVTMVVNKVRFEITTFRKEIKYENNRFPVKIKYVNHLMEDLKRRDFTINTLCIDYEGEQIDLLNAKKDLDNKLIKTVGNASLKIKEDILRSLRAIRFATVLDFRLDEKLKEAIVKNKELLKKLSFYRKKDELEKIFSSTNAGYGISLLEELNLFPSLSLEPSRKIVVTTCSLGIWAQFNSIQGYLFSSHEKEIIQNIQKVLALDILDNKVLYKYGLYVCTIAGEIQGIDRGLIVAKYNNLPIFNKKDIKMSVLEICSILNKEPGEFVKDVLNQIENAILDGKLANQKETITTFLYTLK